MDARDKGVTEESAIERFHWKRFGLKAERSASRSGGGVRSRTAKFSYNFNFLIWNLANLLVSRYGPKRTALSGNRNTSVPKLIE